ncbi:MAG: carbohydrate-binding domain-containing protein, partial [Clostridia bacterium]|nr:carbohydrate-binding domain-containing protein [Clostridia bacterium]
GDDQTAIFSKNDLTIKGAGTLTAISESGNGIRCKNDLDIGDVDLVVNAGNNGIKGDESVKITKKNRSVTVTAGGDGIKTDELPYYDEETGEYVTGGVITINGGNVIVNAAEDGIQSDTLLTVNAGALDITAGGEALKSNASSIDYLEDSTVEASPAEGDGCIVINGGTINAVSGEDGIKATKDVTVNDGTVTVKSALDGIQAGDETEDENYQVNGILTINGGTLDITSGGGHTGKTNPTLSDSMKGIKSNYQLTVNGGDITVNSRDDSVHCDYRIDITGGTLTLDSDDDGVHADSYLYVSDNADINVQSSYEGIEAAEIYMSGGSAKVVAKDDGINAAGDNPNGTAAAAVSSNNRGGFGGGMGGTSSYGYIEVSGGYLYIEAEGDGFDSNGNALITGGEVYVNGPTSGGNGVFDVGENNNTLVITGGTVIGAGTSDMAVTPTQSNGSQAYVVTTVSTQSAGKAIKLTDASGNAILNYTPSKNYSWVLISTPNMVSGQSYTLTYGTNQTTLTAQTSGGSNGMGGQPMQQGNMGGNMGGQMSGQMGGRR